MSETKEIDPMADDPLEHSARWTDDCQGKKDFDAPAVLITTRYWPGYQHVLDTSRPELGIHPIPTRGPSAEAQLVVNHGEPYHRDGYADYFVLAEADFDGATEAEVKGKVEAWVQGQFLRMVSALRKEFGV